MALSVDGDGPLGRLTSERALRARLEAERPAQPGRLSPRQRLELLVDPGSFLELGSLTRSQLPGAAIAPADGLVAGWARIAGREVGILAEDPMALTLTDGQVAAEKSYRIATTCTIRRVPLVYLADGPTTPAPAAPEAVGELFGFASRQLREPTRDALAAPSVAIAFGPCGGAAGELAASCDAVFGVADRQTTLPLHADLPDEERALATVRQLFGTLPDDSVDPLVQTDPRPPAEEFDADLPVHPALEDVLAGLFDEASVVALTNLPSTRTGVARLDGWPIAFAVCAGTVPVRLGVDDVAAVGAVARLARRTRIPLLLVQDSDGYDPATDERELMRVLPQTLDELRATLTPKLGVILGHGHVLGTWVLGGRRLGMDFLAALPTAEVATLDVPAYRPGSIVRTDQGPWLAAGLGHLDEVLAPAELRPVLASVLSLSATARSVPAPEQQRAGRFVDDIAKV